MCYCGCCCSPSNVRRVRLRFTLLILTIVWPVCRQSDSHKAKQPVLLNFLDERRCFGTSNSYRENNYSIITFHKIATALLCSDINSFVLEKPCYRRQLYYNHRIISKYTPNQKKKNRKSFNNTPDCSISCVEIFVFLYYYYFYTDRYTLDMLKTEKTKSW